MFHYQIRYGEEFVEEALKRSSLGTKFRYEEDEHERKRTVVKKWVGEQTALGKVTKRTTGGSGGCFISGNISSMWLLPTSSSLAAD